MFEVRMMRREDVTGVVALQPLAFPPPFDPDLWWDREHIEHHLEIFPQSQFVVICDGQVIGACSNTMISEERWQAHEGWSKTVGGPFLETFDPFGSTLYGLDISVHPDYRRQGVGKALYQARFDFARDRRLVRYGTACRMPGYRSFCAVHESVDVHAYAQRVVDGATVDMTLTPLLRMGMTFLGVIESYMDDAESGDAAALLEFGTAKL